MRIEADEPEDMDDAMQNAIMIEDDAESDAYSCTFQVLNNNSHMTVLEELKKFQRMVTGDGKYRFLSFATCNCVAVVPWHVLTTVIYSFLRP